MRLKNPSPSQRQVCPTVATMCLKSTRFIKPKSADNDIIIFQGIEPDLNWKKYIKNFMKIITLLGAFLVLIIFLVFK